MDVALACWQCGTPVTGVRFCTACGAALTGGDPAPAAPGAEAAFPPVPRSPQDDDGPGSVPYTATAVYDGFGAPPWAEAYPAPVPGPQAAPRSRQPWRAALAVLVVAALGLSCWVLMHGGERHVLSGTVLLIDSSVSNLDSGDSCRGSGGYSDINAGAQVVLTDGTGTTMSTTVLSGGEYDGKGCVFAFELHDVRHVDFYRLAIAGSNRGQLQYSYADLAGESWSVQLSLGDD
jgi:hypothetical protein